VFTREELGRIYKFDDEIGLKVLGFKPRSTLKTSHNVTHSSFVYPDETVKIKQIYFLFLILF
jgi:ATP-dependent DNA helicase 2 subunit 1